MSEEEEEEEKLTLCDVYGCDDEATYWDQTVVEWQCTQCGTTRTDYLYQ